MVEWGTPAPRFLAERCSIWAGVQLHRGSCHGTATGRSSRPSLGGAGDGIVARALVVGCRLRFSAWCGGQCDLDEIGSSNGVWL
jgi:hypothetical protein